MIKGDLMKILVTGSAGQLGTDVMAELAKRNKTDEPSPCLALGIDISELDITDGDAVHAYLSAHKPQCVIHCAAYTAVDKAEDEVELCFEVNEKGTENLARACKEIDAEMIYISTDYVFDGKGDEPYETDAVKASVSTYGKSKLAGEEAVLRYLEKYYIVRISWVFGHSGNNFVKTMLKLASGDGPPVSLNVVSDQVGSPTYTPDLAVLLCDMALSGKYGAYHATNEGFCTWAEFAIEIMRQSKKTCKINPIPTEQYPTKATRPKNSRLSKASLDDNGFARLPEWQDALKRFLGDM
jgi:dTDP-4-dehydrorhamnose reductase